MSGLLGSSRRVWFVKDVDSLLVPFSNSSLNSLV